MGTITFSSDDWGVDLATAEAGFITMSGTLSEVTEANVKKAIQDGAVKFSTGQQTRGLLVFNGTDAAGAILSSVYLLRDDNWNLRVDTGELIHVADVHGTLAAENFAMSAAGQEETSQEVSLIEKSFGSAAGSAAISSNAPLTWWERINITDGGAPVAITDFATVGVTGLATDRAAVLERAISDYLEIFTSHAPGTDDRAGLLFRYETNTATNYTLFVDDGDGISEAPGTTGDVRVDFSAESFIDSPWSLLDQGNLTNLKSDVRMVTGKHDDGTTIDVGFAAIVSTGGFTIPWDGTGGSWTLTGGSD
ncbi:MAG: hypothetical protein FD149_879 [Rhodospirillaceae bacterium]|nr:MAG: hypothetical protein FD149_879 [Rhodospirillaceae bacterium]